jgi:hypothetical protein
MPEPDYRALPALNISLLKEMRRSPKHFQHARHSPKQSAPMRLGTAAHVATLEPERYAKQFAVWDRRTEADAMAPRRGKHWDAFIFEHDGQTVITADEADLAQTIAAAVRSDPVAAPYLSAGEPEVVIEWLAYGRPCKGRADWLTTSAAGPTIVGLKTARDCRPFPFGVAAAKLGYHLQWAWYHDGYWMDRKSRPQMVEIVVEPSPPHAVVVYSIPDDVIDQGRDEFEALVRQLDECEARNVWPGPAETEQILTLPSWVYGPADDDISELGLEAA